MRKTNSVDLTATARKSDSIFGKHEIFSGEVFVANQRRGYSVLERPEEFQTSEDI